MKRSVSGLPMLSATFASALCASLVSFSACSDLQTQIPLDDGGATSSGNPGGGDSGNGSSSGGDGGEPGNDGGPVTVSRETIASGLVQIQGDYALGEFASVGSVVKTSDASCVAFVRSATAPLVSVGTLALTGGLVGQAGGPAMSPLAIPSPSDNRYEYTTTMSERLFSSSAAQMVTLTRGGSGTLSPFATPPTLATPVNATLMITRDSVALSTATPFRVVWTVSGANDAGVGAPFVHVTFEYLATAPDAGASKTASILCSFPATVGVGEIGSAFLTAVSAELGAPASGGIFAVHAGGRAIDTTGGGYFVTRTMTASIASSSTNVSLR